jgi:hypothetical protein
LREAGEGFARELQDPEGARRAERLVWNSQGFLFQRRVVREIAFREIFKTRGIPILAGAFGAAKPGNEADATWVLRFIMNFARVDLFLKRIAGDIAQLTGAMARLAVLLGDEGILMLFGDDLTCSF